MEMKSKVVVRRRGGGRLQWATTASRLFKGQQKQGVPSADCALTSTFEAASAQVLWYSAMAGLLGGLSTLLAVVGL